MKRTVSILIALFFAAGIYQIPAADEASPRDREMEVLRQENDQLKKEIARLKAQTSDFEKREVGWRRAPRKDIVRRRTMEEKPAEQLRYSASYWRTHLSDLDNVEAQGQPAIAESSQNRSVATEPRRAGSTPAVDGRGMPVAIHSYHSLEEVEETYRQSSGRETRPVSVTSKTPEFQKWVFDKLYLRQEVFSEDGFGTSQKAAEFTYVHPGKGDDTYAIDAGLGAKWQIPNSPLEEIALGAEYHHNSDPADRSENLKLGIMGSRIVGRPRALGSGLNYVLFKGSAFFTNDNVDDFQSVSATLNIFPVIGPFYIDQWVDTGPVRLKLAPSVALAFEKTSATADGVEDGDRAFVRARFGLESYPLYRVIGTTLQLDLTLVGHWVPTATGVFKANDRWSGHFSTELTYWFREEEAAAKARVATFGIGLAYDYGNNPEDGLKDQDILKLSFKALY